MMYAIHKSRKSFLMAMKI